MNGDGGRLAEILGLEPETLTRVAHRTVQWAGAIESQIDEIELGEAPVGPRQPRREQLHREAASLFAIAGSYRLLLDAGEARPALLAAAGHSVAVGSTFAHPLAVCGADIGIAGTALKGTDRPLSADDRADVLLGLGWLDMAAPSQAMDEARGVLHNHLEVARSVAETPVGRLRIPLEATIRVVSEADAVAHGGADGLAGLAASLHDALIRIHDVTSAAMGDRFHWRRLLSNVLPVEPEAAALGAIAMHATMRHEADAEMLDRLDLPPVSLVPLFVGREIARQAR